MGSLKSLRGKTTIIVIASVLIIAAVMGGVFIPKQVSITSEVLRDYMVDMATSTGRSIDAAIALHGKDVLEPEKLKGLVQDVHISGFDSSYCYVINKAGTIIYHPVTERIGLPVENDAMRAISTRVQAGEHPTENYLETSYQGTKKIVTFYISESEDFILVLTIDKSDIKTLTSEI